jgi:glutathione peroxidase
MSKAADFYAIKINTIEGLPLDLNQYKGKKMMIVNVASHCGFTKQYASLEQLYQSNIGKFVIIGCPCNDFGGQEPDNEAEIAQFCSLHYDVHFPLTQKIEIVNNRHELYSWLTDKSKNGVMDADIKWNFHKFLIEADGSLYKSFSSEIDPLDYEIVEWLHQ